MRHRLPFLAVLALAALSACNEDSTALPPPPALGPQIDRIGRPGINTAVTDPFDLNSSAKGRNQDAYNAASDPAQWRASFAGPFAGNLAILDSLDTVCGNQLLAGPAPVAGRYSTLATVLADDQLYVNTSSGSCQVYLAVEANAVGITNSDCGGRTPVEDVIDRTYSVLAAGALAGVSDGVDRDADGGHSTSAFPFLAPPN